MMFATKLDGVLKVRFPLSGVCVQSPIRVVSPVDESQGEVVDACSPVLPSRILLHELLFWIIPYLSYFNSWTARNAGRSLAE